MTIDLSQTQRVHLVGAGGSGMNAIGVVLAEMGHRVSGSDMKESSGIARLRALGAQIAIGHDADNVGSIDVLARSTAVPTTNPEVVRATEIDVPVLRRADILAAICGQKHTIAVAGTHGKTTTSSMLSLALVQLKQFEPAAKQTTLKLIVSKFSKAMLPIWPLSSPEVIWKSPSGAPASPARISDRV